MDDLLESRATLLAEATSTPGQYNIQLIDPGWGSSGYYSSDVLAEAASAQIFPAGLHMYADHPTATDAVDRPERSIRDLWGILESDASVNESGALVAVARVFSPYQPLVEEMKDAIGLSIRAGGVIESGEVEGRQGMIVTEIGEARSVDFVTAAGRGGKVLELIESARVDAKESVAEAFPGGFTANDLRDALCSAVSETYGGEEKYAWVRDYTDTEVIFELDGAVDKRGNFRQAYTVEGSTLTLTDDRQEVTPKTTWEPVAESVDPPPDPTAEPPAPIKESHMTDPSGAPVATSPRQVIEAQVAELHRQVAQSAARDRARDVVAEVLADAWLAPSTVTRLTNQLLEAGKLPLVNDELDEAALRDLVVASRDQAETELAESLQASGVGRPRGLGALPTNAGGQSVNLEDQLAESFMGRGMSESAARIAAKGR